MLYYYGNDERYGVDMSKKGIFIVLEGLDGCGKSTQAALIAEYYAARGNAVEHTREPQNERPTGKLLRSILSAEESCDARVTAALFAADRLDHILHSGGIADSLNDGKIVICDRYYLSNFAYNAIECDLDWVVALNSEAMKICRPDLHIFVDVPPEVSLERISGRGSYEIYEKLDRLRLVRRNYIRAIDRLKDTEKIVTVDGTKSREGVFRDIIREIDGIL